MIVQRKIVVCPDGKKRMVVRRTAARKREAVSSAEAVAAVEEAAALAQKEEAAKKKGAAQPMQVLKAGFLKQQGGRSRAWLKMYFVLRGHILYFYRSNTDKEPVRQANMTGLRVVAISEKRAALARVFQIFHPTKVSVEHTLFMQAPTQKDYEEWIEALQRAMGIADKLRTKRPQGDAERMERLRQRMANRQQAQMAERQMKKELSAAQLRTVDLVTDYIISEGGLTMSDLLSADPVIQQQARNLMARYTLSSNEGKELDLDPEVDDVRAVMGFLRLFLISIDYPVLTYGQYDELISSYHKYLALDRVERYQRLIDILPPVNCDMAKRLLEFFCYVSFNSDKNGVSVQRLVQNFDQALLRSHKEETADTRTASKVTAFLIRRAYLLFPLEDLEEFDPFGDDAGKMRFALRQVARFGEHDQLPGTGVGQINVDDIGTGRTIENVDVYKKEVTESVDKFARDVGTQGFFMLVERQIENIQAQIERLASADQEIAKWDELDTELKDLQNDINEVGGRRKDLVEKISKLLK